MKKKYINEFLNNKIEKILIISSIFVITFGFELFPFGKPLDEISYKIENIKNNIEKKIPLMYSDQFLHLYIKNSSWDEFLLSDNFKKKYNNKTGILPDMEIEMMHFIYVNNYVENKCMTSFELNDGKVIYAITKLVYLNDDKTLDDIETYIIPDDKVNLSYEEMYQLAFND